MVTVSTGFSDGCRDHGRSKSLGPWIPTLELNEALLTCKEMVLLVNRAANFGVETM